jgi:uncharacterized protein (DUF1778 family)
MKLAELAERLQLRVEADAGNLQQDAAACYVSDLLSNVMGQAAEGAIWVTMQGHQNIAAVASLLALPAIIVAGDAPIEAETIKKAQDNGVTILSTAATTFEVAGKLYAEGLKGSTR